MLDHLEGHDDIEALARRRQILGRGAPVIDRDAGLARVGASGLDIPRLDVYTALERGTVDGYGWPTQGVLDLGWHEVTKYRVDPAFYGASVEVLINLDVWNSLDDAQKGVLRDAATWMESLCAENLEINEAEKARQAEVGIETITFDDAYLDQAYETGWAAFIEANPENGPKLRELLTRAN
jgi:TRAP-type C4-dicarboxylate transport system substrate-binding protein